MQSVETMSEWILYWHSLDTEVRALAERLLERFAVTVGDLPAIAAHHAPSPAASTGVRWKSRSRGKHDSSSGGRQRRWLPQVGRTVRRIKLQARQGPVA